MSAVPWELLPVVGVQLCLAGAEATPPQLQRESFLLQHQEEAETKGPEEVGRGEGKNELG